MHLLALYGSGGHSTELSLLLSLLTHEITTLSAVLQNTDTHSTPPAHAQKYTIERPREVHGSYTKAIWGTIRTTYQSSKLLKEIEPDCILVNGPGVSLCMVIANWINGIHQRKAKVIYVESLARVNDLSLTGKIIYNWPCKLVDGFLVQWPELCGKYKNAEYIGNVLL